MFLINFHRRFALALSTGFLTCIVLLGSGNVAATPNVSNRDRADIINQMLARELVGKRVNETDDAVSDFELLTKTKGGIVISLQNITTGIVPKLPNLDLLALTPLQIQAKADKEGDFMYLSFTRFEIKRSKVVVTLAKLWARSKTSEVAYMSGGAATYEFRKRGSKWVARFVQGFIV